ncbi:lysophospholipid acyltransferase family protein [Campylobacter troglodytis]|uniref:lysophospholipid acyltransferase family protein n=1 Tax=Campylobacter troglodytis TaxID=654363 RepID=UPI003CFDC32A
MTKFKAFSKKPAVIKMAARLLWLLQWLIFLSCKKSYFGEALLNRPCVLLFFHGKLALMPFIFRRFWKGKKRAFVMISQHEDGELITQNIENFGIDTVRGSTFKEATTALRQAFRVIDSGEDLAITPDGPRGPYQSISDGSVLIAQKKKVPILLLNYEASSFWEFKSWDKMILPKPFCHIKYRISKPLFLENLEKNEAKEKIKENFAIISNMDSFKKER